VLRGNWIASDQEEENPLLAGLSGERREEAVRFLRQMQVRF
jgi:hypothetical protein